MNLTAVLLSRLQFAFTISFHIIFPSFTIGLSGWLVLLETLGLVTRKPIYRRLFDFWLKIFAIAFGLGVVSGIVMAFEFGTNWSELSRMSGPIQGPLLSYESFMAFALEASFFGVLIFGRERVKPGFYLFAVSMVALGTMLSAYWIMVNNSWMQVPTGYAFVDGVYRPISWFRILFNSVVWVRFPHALLAGYITSAFCVAATGAWYRLRNLHAEEALLMLRMGLFLGSVLLPIQMFVGHLTGDYVHEYQPAKFAAIEGRWNTEAPAKEVLVGLPDSEGERNRYEMAIPVLGSVIASMSTTSREVGLKEFPVEDRPPVAIPFFAFRIMVACGLWMLFLAWFGSLRLFSKQQRQSTWLLRLTFLSFPLPFIATLTGWFTAEVGRQPWVVYGLLRTSKAVTPTLTTAQASVTLAIFCTIYATIFTAGTYYIYRLLKAGVMHDLPSIAGEGNAHRPLASISNTNIKGGTSSLSATFKSP